MTVSRRSTVSQNGKRLAAVQVDLICRLGPIRNGEPGTGASFDSCIASVLSAMVVINQQRSLEVSLEKRCPLVFSYSGSMCYYIDLSVFAACGPGRAFSQRANVQRSAKEPLRRAARSGRSRFKTVYDELRLLSWNQRTRNRKHPRAIQRAHAISTRRRGLLVHHNRICQQRHARLGQPG